MYNRYLLYLSVSIILLLSNLTGCLDSFFPLSTTYESHPTKLTYDLAYGYEVVCSGSGKYEINYSCDIPEVLRGECIYELLYTNNYKQIREVNNTFIKWSIQQENDATYSLGLQVHVEAESFLISDLTGKNALSLQTIKSAHPEIVSKYTEAQSTETKNMINPLHPQIHHIAYLVAEEAATDNAFLLAKSLFVWLKENIEYQVHNGVKIVQPALETLQKKSGDCDDLSFLYVSLCRTLDIPARFIRGYLLSEETNGMITATAHAWTEVFVGNSLGNNGWIPVECAGCASSVESEIHQNIGVESAYHRR
jgi:hypothetical protein